MKRKIFHFDMCEYWNKRKFFQDLVEILDDCLYNSCSSYLNNFSKSTKNGRSIY